MWLLGVAAVLLGVLLAAPANAVDGRTHVEAEGTTCTGETTTSASHSGGAARFTRSATEVVTCTIAAEGTVRMYALRDGSNRSFDLRVNDGAATLYSVPAQSTTEFQSFVGSVSVPAGAKITLSKAATAGTFAPVLDFYTVEAAPDTTAPTAPGAGSAVANGADVDVSWGASSDAVGVTGYDVSVNGAAAVRVTTTAYKHTGASGADQSYSVTAVDAAGNRSAATAIAYKYVPPPDTTAPTVPTGLAVAANAGDVDVTWAASTDAVGVAGYDVRIDATTVVRVTGLAYKHLGGASADHTYEVRAYDAAGNASAYSPVVSYLAPVAPAPAPSPSPSPSPSPTTTTTTTTTAATMPTTEVAQALVLGLIGVGVTWGAVELGVAWLRDGARAERAAESPAP